MDEGLTSSWKRVFAPETLCILVDSSGSFSGSLGDCVEVVEVVAMVVLVVGGAEVVLLVWRVPLFELRLCWVLLGRGRPTMVLLTMLANGRIGVEPKGCFFGLGALGLKRTGSSVDWIMFAMGVLLALDTGQQTAGMIRFLRQTDCLRRALSNTSQMHLRMSLHSPSWSSGVLQ